MTTYTSSLRFVKPADGALAWGNTVNNGFTELADTAIAGTTTVTLAGSNVTLTDNSGAADQARAMFLVLDGSPGATRDVIVPSRSKLYFVHNNTTGGFAQTINTAAGTGISVPNGARMALRCDGTNVVEALNAFVNISYTGTLTGSTGVINIGSGQIYKDGSGNVGIGTSSPGAKLDVNGDGIVRGFLTATDAIKLGGNTSAPSSTDAFIYRPANNTLGFGTASAEKMRLDSSGNLGIGTNSPVARFDVNGPASVTSFTGSTRLGITVKGSTSATDYSGIDFSGNSQTVPTARIAVISTAAGSSLSFGTSNNYATGITNTAMTLDADGNLGVGITPSAAVKIYGLTGNFQHGVYGNTQGTGPGYYGVYGQTTKSVASGGVLGLSTNGTTLGILGYFDGTQQWAGYFAGSTYATGTYQGSDARLKENVQPLSGSLQKLTALRPVKFDWKQNSDPERNGIKHDVGLIAQEVLPVLPDVVKEVSGTNPLPDSDPSLNSQLGSFYTIEYTKLVPHLISAIQEQQAIIEDLRARVAALEVK